jgi:methionine-rich copper-binding protein CopC
MLGLPGRNLPFDYRAVGEGTLTKRAWVIALALLAMVTLTSQADAHAKVKQASPEVESTVKTAPGEVIITFTEALEPKFSKIEVQDSKGQRVDQGAAQVVPGEPTRLAVALKPLPTGTYRVTWRVVSVDTHRSEGSYQFIVAP